LFAEPDYHWPNLQSLGMTALGAALRRTSAALAGATGYLLGRIIARLGHRFETGRTPKASRRLLLLRTDGIGDLVLFTGAVHAFRRLLPDWHITLMVPPECGELTRCGLPVDRVIPGARGFRAGNIRFRYDPFFRFRLLLRVACADYDLAIYAAYAREPLGSFLLSAAPARRRVAHLGSTQNQFDHQRDRSAAGYDLVVRRGLRHLPEVTPHPAFDHEFWRHAELLAALGADEPTIARAMQPTILPPGPAARWAEREVARVDPLGADLNPVSERWLIGVAPGAGDPRRSWPTARFAAVLDALAQRQGPRGMKLAARCLTAGGLTETRPSGSLPEPGVRSIIVFVLGSAGDQALAEILAGALGQGFGTGVTARVVDLCGRTTLDQAAALVARLDLLLSNESSLLHIAVAMDRPVVCVLGGGHRGQFFPWGDPNRHRYVAVDLDCAGCNWRCKYDSFHCIEEVGVPDVAAEAFVALEAGGARLSQLVRHNSPQATAATTCSSSGERPR
jgi:ADP-heptose:LPS heptosyltransferase